MATSIPAEERQLFLMENMNRRLDSILESQKKLKEANAAVRQDNVTRKTGATNNSKRGSKLSRRESKGEVPMDLRVGLLSCCFDDIRNAFDRESLCLFFGAELIACLQRRRLACVVSNITGTYNLA